MAEWRGIPAATGRCPASDDHPNETEARASTGSVRSGSEQSYQTFPTAF